MQQKNEYQRLKVPISIVKGTKTYIERKTTLKDLLNDLQQTNGTAYAESLKIRNLAKDNPQEYKRQKDKLQGFIIGDFTKRAKAGLKEYVPLLGFDFDNLEPLQYQRIISKSANSPYIFACFPSPSYKGCRLLVWANSTKETHGKYYQKIMEHLSMVFNLPISDKTKPHIDGVTKDYSRFWYYTAIGTEIYLNKDSLVFSIEEQNNTLSQDNAPLTNDDKLRLTIDIVKQRNKGRNCSVFDLACIVFEYGLDSSIVEYFCISNFEELNALDTFDKKEIQKSVNSAYKTVSTKGNLLKYNDKQLFTYANKILGYQSVNSILGRTLEKTTNTLNTGLKQGVNTSKTPVNKKVSKRINKTINEATKRERPARVAKIPKITQVETYLKARYQFRLNILSNEVEAKPVDSKESYKLLNEFTLLHELLKRGFNGIGNLVEVLMASEDFIERYDPIEDYCKNLPKWTLNKPDYIEQLANYVKAKDQVWFNAQFKKMLVRTLACGLKMIPFNKQCFTLFGKQNDGKSTFIRFLCPPQLQPFYSEDIDFQSKDGRIALATNFIINLDELDSLQRKEITSVKKFMSTSKIKVRLPFGKRAVPMERRVSFLATTNEGEFLTDTTGNVRWLVFEIKGIQHDDGGINGYDHNINMDLVYSQAYSLLKSGFSYQLSRKEIAQSEANNKHHQVSTIEMDFVQKSFEPSTKEKGVFCTTGDILHELQIKTITKLSSRKLGEALRFLGFERTSIRKEKSKYPVNGYWIKRF